MPEPHLPDVFLYLQKTKGEKFNMEFFQLYKFLFKDKRYKSLSSDARILYAILSSRNQLSKINGFCDKDGNVFVIYTRKDLSEEANLSENIIAKGMKQLREQGLISEKKQGRGLPNRIYITEIQEPKKSGFKKTSHSCAKKTQDLSAKKAGSISIREPKKTFVKNLQNRIQEPKNLHPQEPKKVRPLNRYIYINKPMCKSKSLSYSHIQTKKDNDIDTIRTMQKKVAKGSTPSATNKSKHAFDYNTAQKELQAKINYTQLISEIPQDKGIVDEIINCMLDVQMSNTETIKIAKEQKPRSLVLKIFSKINFDDIKFVIQKLKTVRKKIIHIAAYIKTMLYNCKSEIQIGIANKKAMEQPPQQENIQSRYDTMPYRVNKFANFKQHDWDWDKIERILQEE